jgi:hypothetical protein
MRGALKHPLMLATTNIKAMNPRPWQKAPLTLYLAERENGIALPLNERPAPASTCV